MDEFLMTVLAGVIVAMVGAAVAYYFGVRQQRQRQVYESQKSLDQRRSAALDEIRTVAHAAAQTFATSATQVVSFTERSLFAFRQGSSPDNLYTEAQFDEIREVTPSLDEARTVLGQLEEQQVELKQKMLSLRAHYGAQKLYLGPEMSSVIVLFTNELEKYHTRLSNAVVATRGSFMWEWSQAMPEEGSNQPASFFWSMTFLLKSKPTRFHPFADESNESELAKQTKKLEKVAMSARDWNYQPYLDALDKEAARLASRLR